MQKILIVEDDPAILLALKDELSQSYQVFCAANAKLALEAALKEGPDLILLDLLLPDMDGFTLCQQFKEKGADSAIIMLTARDAVVDKVQGLELGADDYITKPFSLEELKARIKAVMRRREVAAPVQGYKDANLQIDFKRYKAVRKKRPLKLSSLEFKLLRFLILRQETIVSRAELLEQVWGYHSVHATRTVDVYILALRKKIGRNYIATCHRQGYRFNPG